jgi:type II secretory pathway predicted ATPase ExeA
MTMYLEHFGLREAPFRITPHTEFFFSGANRGATLEALLYAITAGEGMVKVTGEVGSGKTMLCRVLMERLPESVEIIYLAVPSLSRDEMLAAIAGDLGIETTGANTTKLVRALQEKLIDIHSTGRQVVALIDEAHAMPLATLEEIRLLSNLETGTEKLLQIVLFGQPELDQHLALAHMRQLKERITHSFTLAPLPPRDIKDYLAFRLRAAGYHGPDLFGPEVLRIIAEASEGLTRRINIFADKTLLAAFAAGTHTVTADHARAAVTDTQIVLMRRDSPRRMALVGALCLAVGIVIGLVLAHFVPAPSPGPALAAGVPAPAAVAAAPAAPIPVASVGAAASESAKARSDEAGARSVAARIAAGRELLASDVPRYAVQLMVTDARERGYLENYLAEAGRALGPEHLFVVPAGSPEMPRLGVLFGTFEERGAATLALASMPEGLKQFRPYVRPIEAVREDARRAERK